MKTELDLTLDLWHKLSPVYPDKAYGANELQSTWTICLNPFISLQPLRLKTNEDKKFEFFDEGFVLNTDEETTCHRIPRDNEYGGTLEIDTDIPAVWLYNKNSNTRHIIWSPNVVRMERR